MWRLLVFAGLLATAVGLPEDAEAAASSTKVVSIEARKDDSPAAESPAKRSPISATGVYGASQGAPHGQYVLRQGDDVQELAPEYLALLQQYLEAQQQRQHQQQQQQHHHQQQPQQQHAPPSYAPYHKHPQGIPLDVEQYHVETSPRRPVPVHQPQQLYYPVEEPQPQHHAPPPPPPPPPQHHQRQHQVVAAEPELRYHQVVPIQYGYEDEQQIQAQQQSPQSIVRAQAQAEAQALAFQKIAQASHRKHQDSALEQIRIVNEKYRSQQQQSALEQISQGEQVSEAGRKERIEPKDPESAYKARLKAQATALVAEQRRAHEAAEYKAHADAILKLQAQQRAHLRAQEEAHHYALNFEKNQQRAQAQAQAIANAQALALYKAHQQARNKAQVEAKQAARAQHEARKLDPKSAPVVQYLLPNNVPLPAPEVYLPEAAKALRAEAAAAAAQQKRLKKPQHLKHQLLIEELDPQLLRRGPGKHEEQQQYVLVDADYYRKAQQQQQQHHQQRPLLRQNEYQGLEEVSPRPHYQQQYQQIDPDKLALLVPVEHQGLGQGP